MYYVEFFNDLTFNIRFDEDGYVATSLSITRLWTPLTATDTRRRRAGVQVLLRERRLLYMCVYIDMEDGTYPDASDFIVFEQKGDTVDWGPSPEQETGRRGRGTDDLRTDQAGRFHRPPEQIYCPDRTGRDQSLPREKHGALPGAARSGRYRIRAGAKRAWPKDELRSHCRS
jgi:hypothetical protein